MVDPALNPPSAHPLSDARTGLVSRPWLMFFLGLLTPGGVGRAVPPGSVPVDRLLVAASPRLLGRGAPGPGPVQEITLGAGLTMTGTTLSAAGGGMSAGYWTPITNGDPATPEILFDAGGDCVVGFVPTP